MDEPKYLNEDEYRSSTSSDHYGLLQERTSERLMSSPKQKRTAIIHFISWIIHAALLFTILIVLRTRSQIIGDNSYRPKSLQKAISLEERLFQLDLDTGNVYKNPPNTETEEAWAKLTRVGIVKIDKDDLEHLGRNSYEMYDGSGYLASISMFHQLHCLNMLRHCAYPGAYSECPDASGSLHILHCVNMIRQAIMCHGDTNLQTWDFEPGLMDKPIANGTVEHTCRNFDAIYEWAENRRVSFQEISSSARQHALDAGFSGLETPTL